MGTGFLDMGIFLDWFKNVSILVMLLLLYNFIPDRFFILRKIQYSFFVGFIFGFAAILATVIQWTATSHSNIGLNAILIPLAGLFGGPLSAGIITFILLMFSILFDTADVNNPERLILVISAVIGSIFFYFQRRKIHKISPLWMLSLLSITIAVTTVSILFISSRFIFPEFSISNEGIQIAFIVAFGLFILGHVILYIDRKKESEFELIAYKEHLEALVQERTTDLEDINALHQATIESTTDGIVVINLEKTIRNYNHAAALILDIPLEQTADTLNIYEILKTKIPGFKPTDFDCKDSENSIQYFTTNLTFDSGKVYEIRITPHNLNGKKIGNVINFRDITKRKHAEDALSMMNQKLILLSGISRHDILNQLTALNLNLNMLLDEVSGTENAVYVQKATQIAQVIQLQIEFTRDYQDLGIYNPAWISLKEALYKAISSFENQNIHYSCHGPDCEIFADPLLERVFYNLIDNSIRHGDHVTSIQVTTIPAKDNLLIRYEDNGIGVEPPDKKRIFEKGYGKHTGLGMFLIHEILSITGIGIEETGKYGSGVRFDISVPTGKFRLIGEDSPDRNSGYGHSGFPEG